MRPIILCLLACALTATTAVAQLPSPRLGTPITFSGEMGSTAESYSVSGRESLRPSSQGEVFINSRLTLFGRFSADLDLLYSTADGGGAGTSTSGLGRQRLNRLGIAPTWSWGRVHLGSFTDTYSRYSLGGVRVNGAGFAINPGLLRVASLYGVTEQPVVGGATDGSYRRRMAGGRVGIGRGNAYGPTGSFLDLSILRAWDEVSSLPAPVASIEGAEGIPVNQFAVTPQENLVIGTNGALELLAGRLRISGEASAAAHSRDRRAPVLDESTLPSYASIVRGLFTPRLSSNADYAYRLETQYRIAELPGSTPSAPRSLNLAGEFERIGPGYVSLGTGSLPADKQSVGFRSQLRFPKWTLGLNSRFQHDNLIGQKLATTDRTQFGASLTMRPTRQWTATVRGLLLGIGNGSADTLRRVDYANRTFNLSNSLALRNAGPVRSVSLNYGYREAGDANPLRVDASLRSHTADVRVAISPNRVLHISPSIGLVRARSGATAWSTRESYALTTTARLMEGRWSSTLALGTSRATPNRSSRASLSSRFALSELQSIELTVTAQNLRNAVQDGTDVQEYVTFLRFVRRFP